MLKATEDPLVQEISKRLVKVRYYKKFTKEQMAELMGVSVKTYEKIENGQSRVRLDQIYKLVGDDPWLSISYLTEGRHSRDISFERGYRKMPADQLMNLAQQYGIAPGEWDKFEFSTIMEFFSAISEYGEEHLMDEDLREAPTVTVFTDMFEVMAKPTSEE